MKTLTVVAWLVAAVTLVSVAATAWVLGREALIRLRTRRALRALEAALKDLADGEGEVDVASLTAKYDTATLDRAVEQMLRSEEERTRSWALRIADPVGLVHRLVIRVREARRWSERAHAAEVLGLTGSPKAVPALVESIRDPHEDMGSVKLAAADALALLRDPGALPLLIAELAVVDEHASPRVADAIVRFGSAAVPLLLDALGTSASTAARVWTARVLGRIADPTATDALVARLSDRSDGLRVAAAEALGHLGDRRALQAVIQATLRDPAPQVRAHAAAAASKIAGADAVDVLVAALADPDYGTRLRALEAFEHIEVTDTSGLERALHDVNPEVKRRAALALERVGFLSSVIENLGSDDRATAERAHDNLVKLGSAGLVDSIAGYLHHASFEVRATIALVCGELAMARTGPLLIAALDDKEWPVRAALCRAIGQLRTHGGPPVLAKLLTDPDEVVRESAAEALAEYDDGSIKPCMEPIMSAYGPGTVPIRWQVVGMAARAGGDDAFSLLASASRDPSERVRARAVTALEGREGAVAALVERLSDASLEVRMAAVSALGSAATEEAFEGLVRALPGAAPDARERIAQALARSASGGLLARLFALAASPSVDVRLGIAWTLGKAGDITSVPTLVKLLNDPDAKVRASAAGALGKVPSPETAKALTAAAGDRDSRVRAAVVNAIAKTCTLRDRVGDVLRRMLADPDAFVRNRAAVAAARVLGAAANEALAAAEKRGMVDDAAASLAWSLMPGDDALARVIRLIDDPSRLERVRAFALREDAPICEAFHKRLRLEVPLDKSEKLDATTLVTRYERVLSQSHDVEGRLVALEALDRIQHSRARDLLVDVLAGDPTEAVRVRAATAVATRTADVSARTALVRSIGDPSPAVALIAIRAMGQTADVSAAPELHRRLGTGTEEFSVAIEEALTQIYRTDVTGFLDRMMGEDRPPQLAASVRVLGRIASREAAPLLTELARSREPIVRSAAVGALAAIADPDAVRRVDDALEDPSEAVRMAALMAIAKTRSETALARLDAIRKDPSSKIRAELARVLEQFPFAIALRLVEGLADDTSKEVRASALVTLLARADEYSIIAFGRVWPKAGADTRREVAKSPRGAAVTEKLGKLLENAPSGELRSIVVSAIGALAAPNWHARLLPVLRDPVANVRIAAVRALGSVDDAAVRAAVAELLEDPDEDVRAAARRAEMRLLG
jgi:HEAT repeat protein